MSPKLLAIAITVVLSWLVIEHPCAAVRNGDSSSNGNRRFYARPMFPSRYSPVDMVAEDEDAMELNKRQLTDDYGHMRFGKRDQFDDYGHMRFGRNHD